MVARSERAETAYVGSIVRYRQMRKLSGSKSEDRSSILGEWQNG